MPSRTCTPITPDSSVSGRRDEVGGDRARAALDAPRQGEFSAIESVLVNLVIKSLFRRGRPQGEIERPHPLRRPRTSSFPSGHATSAFTSAVLLSEGDDLWPLYYALAVVVAASRVHVRIHHASDVVAGAAIGLALGHVGKRLAPLPVRPVPGAEA